MNYNEMEVLIQLIPAQKTCTIRYDYSELINNLNVAKAPMI